jgi:hypothetical protein
VALIDELVPPWKEWEDPSLLSPEQVIARLDQEVAAAVQTEPGRVAAVGLICAVGNWEWVSGRRDQGVLDRANQLLDEHDQQQQSKRWG